MMPYNTYPDLTKVRTTFSGGDSLHFFCTLSEISERYPFILSSLNVFTRYLQISPSHLSWALCSHRHSGLFVLCSGLPWQRMAHFAAVYPPSLLWQTNFLLHVLAQDLFLAFYAFIFPLKFLPFKMNDASMLSCTHSWYARRTDQKKSCSVAAGYQICRNLQANGPTDGT